MPATIRFRDGSESQQYWELVVTGWAGIAPTESGIHVAQECPACGRKNYSALTDPSQLIDRNQWTNEDFFIAWPLPVWIFITERVAEYLNASSAKSFSLIRQTELEGHPSGSAPGNLLWYMPEEFAVKYGRPLGLE